MDIIHRYQKNAYNKNFEFTHAHIEVGENSKKEITQFLNKNQNKNTVRHALTGNDVSTILNVDQLCGENNLTTLKLVIQKANFEVQPSTVANGVTTRLLFLTKAPSNTRWTIYGYAKARYNQLSTLGISDESPIGWTLYSSASDAVTSKSYKSIDILSLKLRLPLKKDTV